jgi:hypothetical protein
LAWKVSEIDDLWISCEQRKIMRRGGRDRETVAERNRSADLQTGHLDHSGCPGKICREYGPKIPERLIGSRLALVTRHSEVDLHEVDPTHNWASPE